MLNGAFISRGRGVPCGAPGPRGCASVGNQTGQSEELDRVCAMIVALDGVR